MTADPMPVPTGYEIATRRMARLAAAERTTTTVVFDFDATRQPRIAGHHAFRLTHCTVLPDESLVFDALAADQILFCLDGEARIVHGDASTTLRTWDCMSLQAAVPMQLTGTGQAASQLLLISADPAAYAQTGRQPGVAGPLDSKRVARWGEVKGYDDAFVTSATPGLEKRVFKLLNRGISQGAHIKPALPHEFPFAMSIVEMEAGKGATLHTHSTEEVFIALDGTLDMHWGDDSRGRIRMGRHELLSMPTGLMRGFRNENGRRFHMLVFVGGWNRDSVTSVTYESGEFNTGPVASAT